MPSISAANTAPAFACCLGSSIAKACVGFGFDAATLRHHCGELRHHFVDFVSALALDNRRSDYVASLADLLGDRAFLPGFADDGGEFFLLVLLRCNLSATISALLWR